MEALSYSYYVEYFLSIPWQCHRLANAWNLKITVAHLASVKSSTWISVFMLDAFHQSHKYVYMFSENTSQRAIQLTFELSALFCFGFTVLCSVIGLKNLTPLSYPIRGKAKTNIVSRPHIFPRILCLLLKEWTMSSMRSSNSGCTQIVGRA